MWNNRNKTIRARLLSVMLSAMLAAAIVPGMAAYAAADQTADDHESVRSNAISELAVQLQDKTRDPYGYVEGDKNEEKLSVKASAYPDHYDLRYVDTDGDGEADTSYVTQVKFQNPFGTCWGFAAISAAETSILSSGLAEQDGYAVTAGDGKKELDLSEKHLTYFTASYIDDESDPQYGEGMHFFKEPVSASTKLNSGGLPFYATTLFSSGMGPNLTDREYPAGSGKTGSMEDVLGYYGKNKEVEKRKIGGKWTNFSYSIDDDWSIDSDYRYLQSYTLKESYILPSSANFTEDGAYEYNDAGTSAIKEQLMAGRAVQIGYYADTSSPDQESNQAEFLNYDTWAQFTDDPDYYDYANHAVTIIGWDDEFSKDNFVDGKVPEGDGAWLVKNSWGSAEEEFPNRGNGNWGMLNEDGVNTGYFWLSYYDRTIQMAEALDFSRSNVGTKYYLDQHDNMPVQTTASGTTSAALSTANVFEAEDAEQLEAVSCQTEIPDTRVTYDIYLLTDDFSDPQDGVRVASESATYKYGGFHKISLSSPVMIQKGQHYSVVVTQLSPNDEYVYSMQYSENDKLAAEYELPSYFVGVINENESFVCIDGEWSDISDREFLKAFMSEYYDLVSYDNFPIKGYSSPVETSRVIRITGAEKLSLLGGENSCTLQMRIRGDSGEFDPSVSWSAADGYEDCIDVEPSDDSGSADKAVVTAKKYGKAYVCVDVEDVGTAVVAISVNKHDLSSVSLENDSYEYTGEAITPAVTVECDHGCSLTEGSDYELSYENNTEPGTATVKVTGTGDHQGTLEASFTITKAKSDNKTVKVVKDLKAVKSFRVTKGKKKFKARWTRPKKSVRSAYTGYQIQYAANKKFSNAVSVYAGKNARSRTVKKLKSRKKYYVRIRAYKKSGNTIHVSAWKTKAIKTK